MVGRGGGGPDASEFVTGRLLLSPWSAFKGVFPMHGTYFFQNEVFEDEAPDQEAMAAPTAHVPLYLQRKGFVPRTLAGECVDQCTMLTRGVR